jgi:cobyrinic acid a,c-diamide synthase
MVGVFKGSANMGKRLQALGYVKIETIKDNILSKKGAKIRGHVFHWSYLDNLADKTIFAYKVEKNKDKVFYDGLIQGNVLASYVHLHFASNINFARNLINSCRKYSKHP